MKMCDILYLTFLNIFYNENYYLISLQNIYI